MRKASNKRVRTLQNAVRATVEGLENRLHLDAGQLDPTYGSIGYIQQMETFFESGILHDTTDGKFANWADMVQTSSGFISNHDVFVDAGGKVMTVGATLGRHLFVTDPAKYVIRDPNGTGTMEVTIAETFDTDFQLTRYDFAGTRDYYLNGPTGMPNPGGDRDVQDNLTPRNYPATRWGELWDVARAGAVDASGTESTNLNYGTIVTVGTTGRAFAASGNIVLARYFPRDGMIKQLVTMTAADDAWVPWSINDMAIQPDGKILVAGSTGDGRTGHDFTVWRFNADFTPDTTFGAAGTGQVRVNFRWWSEDEAMSLAIQPAQITNSLGSLVVNPDAGKIVIAGYSDDSSWQSNGTSRMVVARLNPNGSFDSTWGLSGILEVGDLGGRDAVGTSIAIQSDGKVLALGAYDASNLLFIDPLEDFNSRDPYLRPDHLDSTVLVRLNANGTLDQSSFGARGRVQISGGNAWVGQSLAIESTGKIIIGGVTSTPATGVYAAATRVTADGFIDGTYGEHAYLPASPAGFKGFTTLASMGNVLPDLFYKVNVVVQGDDKAILTANAPLMLTFGGLGLPGFGNLYTRGSLPTTAAKFDFVATGLIARLQADNKAPKAELLTKDVTISEAQPGIATFDFVVSYADDGFVDLANILLGQDIVVTGPNGFSAIAAVVGAPSGSGPSFGLNYNQFTVTYRITTPNNWWVNGANNGAYTVALAPRNLSNATQGISDTLGQYALGRQLGQFAVAIVQPDVLPPSVVLVELPVDTNAADAGNLGVTLGGGSSLDFVIEYSDPSMINRARLGSGDVLVTGPSNYSQLATFISASTQANALTIRATYRIAAPGGLWDTTDNGAYSIQIRAFEVGDNYVVANYVPAGELTKFNVAVVPSSDVRPNAVLVNAAGNPLPAQAFAAALAQQELFVHYSASSFSTSGTIASATFINNNNAIHVVSASPVFDRFATYASHVSDSAGGFIVRYQLAPSAVANATWAGSNNGSYVVRIEASQVGDGDAPTNYVAPSDLGTFTVNIGDQEVPTVALSGQVVAPAIGSTSLVFTVIYSDDQAINATTIDGSDLEVRRTAGGTSIVLSMGAAPVVTPAGNGTPLTVTYTFLSPGTAWNYEDNGIYTIFMKPGQVMDIDNKPVAAGELAPIGNADTFTFTDLPPVLNLVIPPIAVGLQNFVLTVTYTDEVGINVGTIGTDDLVVSRIANGQAVDMQLVAGTLAQPNPAINIATNGTPRVVTYTFAPIGGYWEWLDNGVYSIYLNPGSITDVGGAPVVGAQIGLFNINIEQDVTIPVATVVNAPNLTAKDVTTYSFEVEFTDNVAVDLQSILNGQDFKVYGSGTHDGVVLNASLVAGSVTVTTSGTPIRARYQIVPQSGTKFTADDNGVWVIRMEANAVTDVSRNAVGSGPKGTFTIAVPDDVAPTAVIESGLSSPIPITATHQIVVIYTDTTGIDLTSISAADIVVTNASGLALVSTGAPVAVPMNAQNTQVRVTYTFDAPGGTWNFQDIGEYEVRLAAGEVRDVANTAADSATLGHFTFVDNAPTATVLPPMPIVVIGTNNVQITVRYNDEVLMANATFDANDIQVTTYDINGDPVILASAGAPVAVQIGTTGAVWTVTYTFLPAGGYWEPSDTGTYTISLMPNQVSDAGGQFAVGAEIGSFEVALGVDTDAPDAVLVNPPTLVAPAAFYDFTIAYTDATAVDYRTITSGDVLVTGSNGQTYVATLLQVTPAAFSGAVQARYRIAKPGGFSALDNGTYTVTAIANQVSDISGNFIPAGTVIGTFVIAAPVPPVTATLVSVGVVVQTSTATTFQVTYSSTYNLNMSTIIGNNGALRVTGPKNFAAFATYVSTNNPSNGLSRTVTYRIAAPGGAWDFSDNGTYTISVVQNNGIRNIAGGTISPASLGTFVANGSAAVLEGSTLKVSGTDASDTIELTMLNATDTNSTNDVIQVIVNNVLTRFNRALVRNIRIDALAGNDTIKINSVIPATDIRGGIGNDTIWGGDYNDTIYGDDGDDYIVGGYGPDMIYGGNGNDRLIGTAGFDTIYGQAGNDNISGGNGNDSLLGGIGNDTLTGGKGRDYLNGDDGDDWLYARDSELDSVLGGAGNDRGQLDVTNVLDVRSSIETLLA